MSSLEERREARRRRRQQEEEELILEKTRSLSRDVVKSTVDANLAARRLERQQRRAQSQQTGDQDAEMEEKERKRQERRRLRQAELERGEQAEEDTSSRRNRRRGTEDENASEETSSSSRRRRNRGGEEEEEKPAPKEPEETPVVEEQESAPAVEDNSAAEAEEAERRRREEEEAEAERERQRQQQEEDRKRRQEEERRQLEEKRRRGARTPRKERQSRPKQRTPRGPLKTPRSARQQKSSGNTSARSIPEEKSNIEPVTPRHPQSSLPDEIRFKKPEESSHKALTHQMSPRGSNQEVRNTPDGVGGNIVGNSQGPAHAQSQDQHQMEKEREARRADYFARCDVKSRIRALEAEKNGNPPPAMEVNAPMGTVAEHSQTNAQKVHNRGAVKRTSPPVVKTPLQSVRSSSDTDWDDRLTDIVANNREMLSNDDTMERFTDFDLGSCSSYDDIFGPKPSKMSKMNDNLNPQLMSTDEFSPVFLSTEDIHERTLVESDTTLHNSPQPDERNREPKPQQQPDAAKSIPKPKLSEEAPAETIAASGRFKNRSSQRERDLRRSNSRTRARPVVEVPSSSESSSENGDHFIPFIVDKDDAVHAGDIRRSSVVERKVQSSTQGNEETRAEEATSRPPKIESPSENDSLFSGDDFSTRNSISVMTSADNLSVDSEDVIEEHLQGPAFASNPKLSIDDTATMAYDMTSPPTLVATAILPSPMMSPKPDLLKVPVNDLDQGDSDNSLEPITASGFFGVKSDIPFNAKKKKINARRSGQKISQMTSIWSKMPPTVMAPSGEESDNGGTPRKIFVIKAGQSEETQDIEESSSRHRKIDTRMTELQQQLEDGVTEEIRMDLPPKPVPEEQQHNQTPEQQPQEYLEQQPQEPVVIVTPAPQAVEESKRSSGRMKEQLDELFGKLNSKLRSHEVDVPENRSGEKYRSKTPMFLAPFDSSVDALQRSQSQPILTSSEQIEYYDPSQSVREYIPDEADSSAMADGGDAVDEDEQHPESSNSMRSSQSSRKDSNIAQCSSDSCSPHLESSLSNWSNQSVLDDSLDSECHHPESPREVCEEEDYCEADGELIDMRHIESRNPRMRKESAFSVVSNVTADSNQENIIFYSQQYSDVHPPNEEDMLERRVHTEEWLNEDLGYIHDLNTRSSNASIVSIADSESALSVDSLDDVDGVNECHDYEHQGHYQYDPMTPRGQGNEMLISQYEDGTMILDEEDAGKSVPDHDNDLKLPLHFLHESSQEEEGYSGNFVQEMGDPNGAGHLVGSSQEEDVVYSSDDDFEEDEDIDDLEEGEVIVAGDGDYRVLVAQREPPDVDVITSMDEMGQDILDYLSDEMDEEGEVEEWGDEEEEEYHGDENHGVENESTMVVVSSEFHQQQQLAYGQGYEGQPSNTGNEFYLVERNPNLDGVGVVDEQVQNQRSSKTFNEGSFQDNSGREKRPKRERLSSRSQQDVTTKEEMTSAVTDSARVREMFKEHHGHIDDKDIVHRDNIPEGHELPDGDEFFLSFEYDEEHRRSVSDYTEEFSDDREDIILEDDNIDGRIDFDVREVNSDEALNNARPQEVNSQTINEAEVTSYKEHESHHREDAREKSVIRINDSGDGNDEDVFDPAFRGLRKQLVAELKVFDPATRLRRTSSEAPHELADDAHIQALSLGESFNLVGSNMEVSHKPTITVTTDDDENHSECQASQITSHNLTQLTPNAIDATRQPDSRRSSNVQNSLDEYVKSRRRSSTEEDGSIKRSGSMSRERRKSIRSFWQQLDEEKKKKKDLEEDWMRRREENRSKERTFQGKGEAHGDGDSGSFAQTQSFKGSQDILDEKSRLARSSVHSASQRDISMEHAPERKLASGAIAPIISSTDINIKTSKKEPPAVAPKPDRARRRSSVEIKPEVASTKSKPQTVISEKSKSVKQIAQFHEMQNKAIQNIASGSHSLASRPPHPTKHVHSSEQKTIKNTPFETHKLVDNAEISNRESVMERSNTTTKSTHIEHMLQKRLSDKVLSTMDAENEVNSMKREELKNSETPSNLETLETRRPGELRAGVSEKMINKSSVGFAAKSVVDCEVNKSTILETKVVAAKEAKTVEISEQNMIPLLDTKIAVGFETNTIGVINPKVAAVPDDKMKRDNIPKVTASLNVKPTSFQAKLEKFDVGAEKGTGHKPSQNTTPLFSQNIVLKAPTLEEIDHNLSIVDDTDASASSHNKSVERVDESIRPTEADGNTKGKSQAPRPKFNAKALAKNRDLIMPAFAKQITPTQTALQAPLPQSSPVPNLNLNTALSSTNSESLTSLDEVPPEHPATSSRELKLWVVDYLKDRICDQNMRQGMGVEPGKGHSETTTLYDSSANSSFYDRLPLQGRQHYDSVSDGQSEPTLSSRSSREAKLSVAERISKMQEMMEAKKEANKPAVEKQCPTQSQRQFASLLQNRLIDVIAQESEEEKLEKEERKKKKHSRPPPNSWAVERQRLFGKGSIKTKVESFNPDSTSTPSTLSRAPTNPLIEVPIYESIKSEPESTVGSKDSNNTPDAATRFENLSESFSKDDVMKMNKVRRADSRKYRRVTTSGVPFSDIRHRFAISDSSGSSSTESFSIPKEKTRPNSPWISASGPSPLVSGVINRLASSENTDAENNNSGDMSAVSPLAGSRRQSRVLERVNAISSGENSLSNSRSSSRSRPVKEVVSGAFDRNLVSELVRRVESSEESGTTSLSSSLSLQPGDLLNRARVESDHTVAKVLQKLKIEGSVSSNSSPSSSMDRRHERDRASSKIHVKDNLQKFHQSGISEDVVDSFTDRGKIDHQTAPLPRLSEALVTMSELQKDEGLQRRNKRLDKDRRHTTQINFKELRDRYNARNKPRDHSPPQSPALKAIYASSTRNMALEPNYDTGGQRYFQIAQSATFQRKDTRKQPPAAANENPLRHPREKIGSNPSQTQELRRGSALNEHTNDLGAISVNARDKATLKPERALPRNSEVEHEDVFSPLVSARVPEAFNLPSDSPPPPAFSFSATSYEDDMSHGELAESESSDTADFASFAPRHAHAWSSPAQQELQHQQPHPHSNFHGSHHHHHHYHQHHHHPSQNRHTTPWHPPATASSSTPPSTSSRHRPAFPETVIDARTATDHVRCRMLSETPLEPDESGIGASDNSLGSSTISVSSVIQDRGVDPSPFPNPPTITVKKPTANATYLAPDQTPDPVESLRLPMPARKLSLGNESVPESPEMHNLLSPRRASVSHFDHSLLGFKQGYTTTTGATTATTTNTATDTQSSNASLSQDSCKAAGGSSNETVHSKHEHKRRKSKSKFMQDVMDKKRRNAIEPSDSGHRSSLSADGRSGRRPISSASDVPGSSPTGSPNGKGLFGPKVPRKKSQGEDNTNTLKGYSKRFDALWAKFDPEQADGMKDSPSQSVEAEEREEEERLERERMEAEEEARQKAEEEEKKKKKGKRKGLGGLTPEKKKLLKKLIMQKAAEDLRNEAKEKAAEKDRYINERVAPLKTDGLGQSELQQLVKDLHAKVSTLEEDVYDWEIKIRKQDFEINELTLKVNDTKGKFIKPVLRKVNKTESKLKKIQQIKESTDFRGNLKSTGQNKYALEEDEPEKGGAHWRDELKSKDKQEGDEPAAETEVAAES